MDNLEELYHLLCSTGYLPPRSEEELLDTEAYIANYQIKNVNRHIDANAIINGSCSCKKIDIHQNDDSTDDEQIRMVARNFDHLPEDIKEKIQKQHSSHGDEDK